MDNFPVGLAGWLAWQLVGRDGRVMRGGEQHNMITNYGLDRLAVEDFAALGRVAVVGTGSNPPAFDQVAMAAELARSALPADVTIERVSDGVSDFVFTREFGFNEANGNLTEWGMSHGIGSNLTVRELFRDGAGNPVVVTKDNSQKLRFTYRLRVTLSPVVQTPSQVDIAGIGVRSGHHILMEANGPRGNFRGDLQVAAFLMQARTPGGYGNTGSSIALYADNYPLRNMNYASYPQVYNEKGPNAAGTAGAYIPGSYTRQGQLYTWDTGDWNAVISSFAITVNTDQASRVGYAWSFDSGQEITKNDQQILTIRGPGISWGRA